MGCFPTGHQTHAAVAWPPVRGGRSTTLTGRLLCAAAGWELHAEAEARGITTQKQRKNKTGQKGWEGKEENKV